MFYFLYLDVYFIFFDFTIAHGDRKYYYVKVVEIIQYVCSGISGSCRDVSAVNVRHNISVCEIVSGCAIFVMKNLTQTERSHLCALFHPRTLS